QNAQQAAGAGIDLHTFWVSIQFKLLIPALAAIIICLGTFKLTKVLIPDQWEASSFLIRHAKNMSSQTDMPYLYLKTDINTLLETILLRENLQQVIDQLELGITPEELHRKVRINKTGKSDVIEVKATWYDPAVAAEIADSIGKMFLKNYTRIQNAATEEIHQYYQRKIDITREQLRTAKQKESEFRSQNNVLDFEAQKENLYSYLAQLELRYVDEDVKRNDLSAQFAHTKSQLAGTSNKIIISELLRTNEGNRSKALRNELEVLRKRYTEDNPKVQHLLHQISVLEIEERSRVASDPKFDEVEYGPNPLHEELSIRHMELESQLVATKGNLIAYRESIASIKTQIAHLAQLAQTHYRLMQDIEDKEDLISKLNTRVVEANLALESNISDFDILQEAQLPEFPKRSFRKVIAIALAIFIAGVITLYILLKEFVNTSLKTAHDLQFIEGASIAAVLPNKDEVPEQLFYSQFQLLFSEIAAKIKGADSKLLTISSMSDGEGKSFIAGEIASLFVKQGKRVLYIESEEYLEDISQDAIINNALYGSSGLNTVSPNKVYEGLDKAYFQTDKHIYLDVLNDEKIGLFLEHCYQHYDLVVWDIFPANRHLQLFRTIAQCAEFNLVLTKSRNTPKKVMNQTVAMMNAWGVRNIGLLINALPKKYIRSQLDFN
ncbi:hypothetical protein A3765_15695, partial [Oleiphilus sp. HI0130]